MKFYGVFIFIWVSFWGCREFVAQDIPRFERGKNVENVLVEESLTELATVAKLNPGDTVLLKIKGVEKRNIFSKRYSQTGRAKWKEYIKGQSSGGGRPGEGDPGGWEKRRGSCALYYRDFLEEEITPVEFLGDLGSNLTIRVGETVHNIKDFAQIRNSTLFIAFPVSEKMLVEGDELSLEVVQDVPEMVQVGFAGYGKCPGKKEKKFFVNLDTSYELMEGQVRREYFVTVDIIRI